MSARKNKTLSVKSEDGQTFIEFVLLLVMMVSISYALMAGINGNIATRWKAIITIIVQPSDSDFALNGE